MLICGCDGALFVRKKFGLVGLVSTFRVSDRVRGFGLVLKVSCSSDVTDTVYKDVIDFLCFERK